MFNKWRCCFIVLIASLILAILGSTPPSSKSLDTPADQFASARAMKDVHIISQAPHPTGSKENAVVREYLSKRLSEMGLTVTTTTGQLDERSLTRLNKWSGENKTSQDFINIIGVLSGDKPNAKALLLMAHHDTVWGSPGAADDTIGIATILEILRIIKDVDKRQRDIIVLFTDAEELGLVGARQFFAFHPLKDKVGAVINFEARGGGGTANMFQTSLQNGDVARLYAQSVRQPSTSSLSVFVYNVLPNDTDLTPALKNKYAAYNIANLGRAEYYHSPEITPEALDENTLQHMGSQGLDLTRALISIETLPTVSPNVTFFDVFGFFTVVYAPALGWIFLIMAMVLYLTPVKRTLKPKQILSGSTRMLAFLVLGGLALFGLNYISGNTGTADYYDRLAAIYPLEIVALTLSITAFFALFAKGGFSTNERFGVAMPLILLGIIGQYSAPTATYFISVALLLSAIASFSLEKRPENVAAITVSVICITLVVGYMFVLGHLLMLGVGPDMLPVVILVAAIAVMAITPIFPGTSTSIRKYIATGGLAVAVIVALWIKFDPIASTVPLY